MATNKGHHSLVVSTVLSPYIIT